MTGCASQHENQGSAEPLQSLHKESSGDGEVGNAA